MKAIVLAGGRGSRLAPYTLALPKPLVAIGNMPLIEIITRQLIISGFTEIIFSLGYLGELIKAYFETHSFFSKMINILFVQEEFPMGTAGSISLVPELDQTFMVINGDVLTTLDFNALIHYHRQSNAALTIAGHEKRIQMDLGVLELESHTNKVIGYIEKPEYIYPVSMGIYVYEPEILSFIPKGKYLDFPELVLRLIKNQQKVVCYQNKALWLDIGKHEDYAHAQVVFESRRSDFRLWE
ncbi:MAG: NTP transferase domain-containing protein [Desulfobacterales bacterium]|nr:NTP transferase domain-containing protein [Desulfobacterales bacterium]